MLKNEFYIRDLVVHKNDLTSISIHINYKELLYF